LSPRGHLFLRSPPARIFTAIFRPPFAGLPIVVWIYFVLCFFVHPHSQILKGNFVDPDDYLYLVQTTDWLQGQSWFDNIQHRLNPPAGAPIHFSRLYELPLAGLIASLRLLLNNVDAATIAAVIFPPVMLALFFLVMRFAAMPFVGARWSRITPYILLFTNILIIQFAPGRVDHHGTVVMLAMAAFGCIVRMIAKPRAPGWPISAGFLLALGLAIGLEILPVLILTAAWIGWWSVVKGKDAAHAAALFGLALCAAAAGFLALTKPIVSFFTIDTLAYSIVYVIFAGCIAVVLAGIALASRVKPSWPRYAIGIGLALFSGALFLHFFPDLLRGPYGGVDPALAKLMFDNIGEAMPRISGVGWKATVIGLLLPLLLLLALRRMPDVRKADSHYWSWGLLAILFLDTAVLGAFYQSRALFFTLAFSTLFLAWFLKNGLVWAGENLKGPALMVARAGIVLLAGPLPMVLLPALHEGRSFYPDIVLFPVLQEANTCDLHPVARFLSSARPYNERPYLLMNMINDGAELLFRTPHMVLSAPFHTNTEGNLDAVRFFAARDATEALSIARRRGVELVVMCRVLPDVYRGPKDGAADAKASKSSFAEQLADGETPAWLGPLPLPGDFLLFRVLPR
jgi:hypothetical protein